MGLPFLLVRDRSATIPVLVSADARSLVGVDVVDLRVIQFQPDDVVGAVSVDPAAVYWGMAASWGVAGGSRRMRMAAEDTGDDAGSLYMFAMTFLANVEYGGDFEPLEYNPEGDPRIERIEAALRLVGVSKVTRILGAGSFGTAAELPDGRVVKLTSDPSEVQAGAVLTGKELKHVVRIDGAWFVKGVKVRAAWAWTEDGSVRKETRAGILIMQAVDTEGMRYDRDARDITHEVHRMREGAADLNKLLGKSRREQRKVLCAASVQLEKVLRNSLGTDIAEQVADALTELRSYGICAIDVHHGNIGIDDEGYVRIFDIGTSSPPDEPRAPTAGITATKPRRKKPMWKQLDLPFVGEEAPPAVAEVGAEEAPVPRFAPKGMRFAPIPSQLFLEAPIISGFGEVRGVLMRHRAEVPSIDTIRLSALFAVSTVRTSIEEAERSFDCFVELYGAAGRSMSGVSVDDIKNCFRGLQNTKSKVFAEVAAFAPSIQAAMQKGLRDKPLRKHLAVDVGLPTGLSLAKLSFTLALLGQDVVCLDARLLGRMFDPKRRAEVENMWGKTAAGKVSPLSLGRYEAVEDAFLSGNPFYRAADPIGKARAQWMSWESVGGAAAAHGVWLRVVG